MPTLPNGRHELFAQNLAKGMTQRAAHRAVGYRPHGSNASALASRPDISRRVAELRGKAAQRAVITTARLIELAEEARLLAMENNQASGAVSAIKEMGMLAGVRVEKRQAAPRALNDMSDAELVEIARGERPDASGAPRSAKRPTLPFSAASAPSRSRR